MSSPRGRIIVRRACHFTFILAVSVAVTACRPGHLNATDQISDDSKPIRVADTPKPASPANTSGEAMRLAARPAAGSPKRASSTAKKPVPAAKTIGKIAAASSGVDWPQFLGPNANGISPEKGIRKDWSTRPPAKLWQVAMSDDGYSGPSVAGGKVFILDHRGDREVVRAIHLATGKEAWSHSYADTSEANYGFGRSTPAFDNGRVYTLSRIGLLHCLNAANGDVVWTRDIVKEFNGRRPGWDLAYSPLIDGKKLVVLTGGPDSSVVALDKTTGQTIWQGGGTETPGYATPVVTTINGKRQYVVFLESSVEGVDPDNGRVLWKSPWITSPEVHAATPLVIGDSVFITSGYGRGCSLVDVKGSEAKTRWENKAIQSHFSSPILYNGHIYTTTDPGNLVCVNPQNGQTLWSQPGFEKGGIVAVDQTILALSGSSGEMVMASLQPSGYRELGRFTPLGGQSWTAPVVSHGKLIVRNKRTLACFNLR